MMDDAPEEIKNVMNDIVLAMTYNNKVGGSITHKDVAKWGILEKTAVFSALDLIGT